MPARTQRFNKRQHMLGSTYEIFRYLDSQVQEVSLHHHDFYEIYFFLSGTVEYNIESRSYRLSPGDVLLIGPMELHQPVFGQEAQAYERIVLWINKQFLESLGEHFDACFDTTLPGHTNRLRLDGNTLLYLTHLMEQLLQESDSREAYSRINALAYLVQVLVLLNRQSQAQRPQREETQPAPSSVVMQVLGYINDHYQEDLPLDKLANRFFTSKYHLSREFQRLVGTSVHRYIIQKRLMMAKQMMAQGAGAAEVYQSCGFGDYSNFYRAFRAEYQISPKEYIATLKAAAQRVDDQRRILRGIELKEDTR